MGFDIERAKRGEPVITHDGTPVKFICWDRRVSVYTYAVYLELTHYSDRLISHPISELSNYLKMK